MKRSLAFAAALAATFAVTNAARADWGVRAGLEAPMVTHVNSQGSYSIADSFQPAIDVLVQYGPSNMIAFGVEGRVGFASTSNYTRTGSSIGPEIMINVPLFPLYARASVPLRLEPNFAELGLRVAAGFKLNLPLVGVYLEAAADMPFFGNDVTGNGEDPFSHQTFSLGLGAELRF
jgi:hypothetical protein